MAETISKIVVTGSRNWTDRETIRRALEPLIPEYTLLIHGGARGADMMAEEEAAKLGISVLRYPADWAGHGRAAGPIRNRLMLTEQKPHAVYAFPLGESRGTRHCMAEARKMGIVVREFPLWRHPMADQVDLRERARAIVLQMATVWEMNFMESPDGLHSEEADWIKGIHAALKAVAEEAIEAVGRCETYDVFGDVCECHVCVSRVAIHAHFGLTDE